MDLEENILNLFYRTNLREGEEIIDNTDDSISKELKIKVSKVKRVISNHLNKKVSSINKRVNSNKQPVSYNQLYLENTLLKDKINTIKKNNIKIKDKYVSAKKQLNKIKSSKQKIEDACIMMKEGQRTKHIMNILGFDTRSVFYRSFKKHKGITVLEYKNQLLK